jgi:hypothetical protein
MDSNIVNLIVFISSITTVILTIYSAILSTIIFLYDNSKIDASVSLAFAPGINSSKNILYVSIANVGKRPLSIVNIYIQGKDKTQYLYYEDNLNLNKNFQKTLKESDSTNYFFSKDTIYQVLLKTKKPLKIKIKLTNGKIKYLKVQDWLIEKILENK